MADEDKAIEITPYRSGQELGDVIQMTDFRPKPVAVAAPVLQGGPDAVAAAEAAISESAAHHPSNLDRSDALDALPGGHQSDDVPLRALALVEMDEIPTETAEGHVEYAGSGDESTVSEFDSDIPVL